MRYEPIFLTGYTAFMLIGNVHLVAGSAEAIPEVLALLARESIETKGNPDVYVRTYKSFGIDEARELRARASLGAFRGRRVFIVATPSVTSEAQNALLKTLEEPTGNALFFFILPSPQTLLPTLRSRSQILPLESAEQSSLVDANAFLAASVQKRLDMLSPLLEKGEEDRRDLGATLAFLAALETSLAKNRDGLHAIYRARKYIADKGALAKPLLEQVALLI